MRSDLLARILLVAGAAACLIPGVSGGAGLVAGIAVAVLLGNPWLPFTKKWTPRLLQLSVIGLGFAMNLLTVLSVGAHGIGYTLAGITLTFGAGALLARLLAIPGDVGILVTVGTAICGGSAIAAVAPVIRARDQEVSVALATVFLLNSIGLLLFPVLGHAAALTSPQFGVWAALAIHDTSSVVGAATQYDLNRQTPGIAAGIATTIKLARALWIVPVALGIGAWHSRRNQSAEPGAPKAARPWFILGFLLAAAINSFVPGAGPSSHLLALAARQLLVLTLFLIGANLSRAALSSVGVRPLLFGILLWIIAASASLAGLLSGWIT